MGLESDSTELLSFNVCVCVCVGVGGERERQALLS